MEQNHIPMSQCKRGHVYKIKSRNLTLGVFDGISGFIGIREKFGSKFLFKEYHWDMGPEGHGTVQPREELQLIPHWVPLKEDFGSVCPSCGRPVISIPVVGQKYWREEHIPHPVGGGKNTPENCLNIRGTLLPNKYLFDFLDNIEKEIITNNEANSVP